MNKPYRFTVSIQDIPNEHLPQLYRSLRTEYVLHLKRGEDIAADSLIPILDKLRAELANRGLSRTD